MTAIKHGCGKHSEAARAHWAEIARRWEQLGPPLRPSREDVAFYADAIEDWTRDPSSHRRPPRGLILGVTPELYDLPWPAGSSVLAVDHAPAMIHAVWQGPQAAVVCGDWAALPLADASRDIVLCDGGLLLLAYPDGLRALAATLGRVIAPGGQCVFRLFVPPAKRESPESVLRDLFSGRIANLNLLKIRLWMALHENLAEGVPLRRVWEVIHDAAPSFDDLSSRLGWPIEHLLAINAYRDSSASYHLLGPAEVCRIFCDGNHGRFACEDVRVPEYELGERCPMIVLRRTGTAQRADSTSIASARMIAADVSLEGFSADEASADRAV